jgi:hypothetical protein
MFIAFPLDSRPDRRRPPVITIPRSIATIQAPDDPIA